MSGHSKWSQIKHKKAAIDAKKGKIFSKMARLITVAAREKGGDPARNAMLRLTIDKAKEFNMPSDNIERAIKRGTGEIEGTKIEELLLEAYGPSGIAIIIEGTTDNKNRTLPAIKHILTQHGGKLAETGNVSYLFERKGVIILKITNNKETLELLTIEAGAEDIKEIKHNSDNFLEIYTKPEELENTKKILEQKNIAIESTSLDWVPKSEIEIIDQKTKEQIEKLFDALDENDDVNEIYSNIKS